MKSRLAIIHLGFALTGIVTTMLGPILPFLSVEWSLNDAQAGRLFTAQFVSSVTGSLIASRVLARWGAAWTVLIGMFVIAAGVALVAVGGLPAGVAGIALYGVGLGFALPCTNLMVSEMVPDNRAAALNLLNFSWTVGALAAPILIASLLKPIGLRGLLLALAASCAIIGLAEVIGVRSEAIVNNESARGRLHGGRRPWFAVLTALLLILYVGVENGVAGWVPSFAQRTQQTSVNATALVQSGFWGAILLGRLAAPVVLKRVRPAKLVFLGLMLAIVGTAITVFSSDVVLLAAGVIASGLGLSAIFPTAIAIFTEWHGTGGSGSIVLGVCGLGGAVVPWMVGAVSEHTSNLRLGMSVNLVVMAMALVVYFLMIRVAMMQTNASRQQCAS